MLIARKVSSFPLMFLEMASLCLIALDEVVFSAWVDRACESIKQPLPSQTVSGISVICRVVISSDNNSFPCSLS